MKKTIAVLLLLSIVLSSCGKKDKDKSNDFVRVTTTPTSTTPPPTTPDSQSPKTQDKEDVKPFEKAVDACIDIHLSCPDSKLSDECSKAKKEDSEYSDADLWQACIDSEPCSEKREDFRKAKLACLNSEIDLNKARKSCKEAKLTCPYPDHPEINCPKAKLVCDKVSKEYPVIKPFCPYSEVDCPAAKLPCDKSDTILAESEKVCKNNVSKKACSEAEIVLYDSQVQCLESHKSCAESELNGTSSEEEEEEEEKEKEKEEEGEEGEEEEEERLRKEELAVAEGTGKGKKKESGGFFSFLSFGRKKPESTSGSRKVELDYTPCSLDKSDKSKVFVEVGGTIKFIGGRECITKDGETICTSRKDKSECKFTEARLCDRLGEHCEDFELGVTPVPCYKSSDKAEGECLSVILMGRSEKDKKEQEDADVEFEMLARKTAMKLDMRNRLLSADLWAFWKVVLMMAVTFSEEAVELAEGTMKKLRAEARDEGKEEPSLEKMANSLWNMALDAEKDVAAVAAKTMMAEMSPDMMLAAKVMVGKIKLKALALAEAKLLRTTKKATVSEAMLDMVNAAVAMISAKTLKNVMENEGNVKVTGGAEMTEKVKAVMKKVCKICVTDNVLVEMTEKAKAVMKKVAWAAARR